MSTFEQTGPADGHPMIALWRNRAEEARAQASQMKDGSVSQELLLSIAAAYLRLAETKARRRPHFR